VAESVHTQRVCSVQQATLSSTPAAPPIFLAISALGHCAASGAGKKLVPVWYTHV